MKKVNMGMAAVSRALVCVLRISASGWLKLAILCAPFIGLRPAHAQTEIVLYNFCTVGGCEDGGKPAAQLTPDGRGGLYGTASYGGQYNGGTVFEISPSGVESVLYDFCSQSCTDGSSPFSTLIADSAGNLYGTTFEGGAGGCGGPGCGTVFELSPTGGGWAETVLYSFTGTLDGSGPVSGVIMDPAGNLYGTTTAGGSAGGGTVFELSPNGSGGWIEQVIYSYTDCTGTGLAIDMKGNLFGLGCQYLYELSPSGSGWNAAVIHNFAGGLKDGLSPAGTPTVDNVGNIYGTTFYGGTKDLGTVYKFTLGKKGYKEKLLHSFKGNKDGSWPAGSIALDSSGNIYGTTVNGGDKNGNGTSFELVHSGTTYKEKILWRFNVTDGSGPNGVIFYGGDLYGTTFGGGADFGVAFEIVP